MWMPHALTEVKKWKQYAMSLKNIHRTQLGLNLGTLELEASTSPRDQRDRQLSKINNNY